MVVTVNLQIGERAEEKGALQVVVPGGKGLQAGHDFVDAFAELHVVGVVLGGVVDGGVGTLERGLGAAVGEGAPVVGDEGLGGVAAGECLRAVRNLRTVQGFMITLSVSYNDS